MRNKIGLVLFFNFISIGSVLPGQTIDWEEVMRTLIYPAQVSYRGEETIIFCTPKGENVTTRVKIFFKPGKLRIEYLFPPDMTTTVLIDDGKYMYSYDTVAKKAFQFKTSFLQIENGEQKYKLLKKNYTPVYLRETEIGKQKVHAVQIKPLNPANPPREIAVAVINNTVLEEKLFNLAHDLIYSSFFTEVNFALDFPDSLFILPADVEIIPSQNGAENSSFEDVTAALKHIDFKFRLPAYIPDGYVFDKVMILEADNNKRYVQLQYHDGLNSISLFETLFNISISAQLNLGLNETKLVEGEVVKVFYNIPSSLIYKKLNYMNCFVIGNLAKEELSKMLLSIK